MEIPHQRHTIRLAGRDLQTNRRVSSTIGRVGVYTNRLLNVVRSQPDERDYRLEFDRETPEGQVVLPSRLTMTLPIQVGEVFDQGSIGSCTANAAGSMYSCILQKISGSTITPSRLYVYWNSRSFTNTTSQDVGCTLRDTMRALARFGVCRESIWSYRPENLFRRPAFNCFTEGSTRQALSYASIPTDLFQMKSVLNAGYPFVFGLLLFSSFMDSSVITTGNVKNPDLKKEQFLGGHAMCAIGYDDEKQAFLVRNSWGRGWGMNGDAYIPYEYMTNPELCFDMWTLYSVEIPSPPSYPGRVIIRRRTR